MTPTAISLVGAAIRGLDMFAMVSAPIGSCGVMRKPDGRARFAHHGPA